MNKLKELRNLHNLTIKQIADIIGISPTYYWQIENGKRNLYYNMAIKIADIFSLKPDDIFYQKKINNN